MSVNPIFRSFPTVERVLDTVKTIYEGQLHRHWREFHATASRHIAGPWHKNVPGLFSRAWTDRQVINPVGEMYRTYLPHVLGDSIEPVVEPSGVGNRGDAKMLEFRMRQWVDDDNYAQTDERIVQSSMIGMGISYINRREGGELLKCDDDTVDLGAPFVQHIPVRNFVADPHAAGDFDYAEIIGHWYPCDRQAMLEAGIGDAAVLEDLPNIWDLEGTEGGRFFSGPEMRRTREQEYIQDTVLLWDICLKYRGRAFCMTLPPLGGKTQPVVKPYELVDEPEGSRYVVTRLDTIPDSLTPLSPAMVMMEAHLAKVMTANKATKMIEELERKWIAKPGKQKEAMRLTSRDGQPVVFGDPDSIKEFIIGGLVKECAEAYSFLNALGEKIGPNVSLAQGSGDPGESATASNILAGNAAIIMRSWAKKINAGREKTMRRVAALLLASGDRREIPFPLPDGTQTTLVWDAASMDISYDLFKYKIRPINEAGAMTQRERTRSLFELMGQIPGMVQMVMAYGSNPVEAVQIVSDLAGMPELARILTNGNGPQLNAQLLQFLTQHGQARQGGAAGAGPQLPGQGPMTPVGTMNSDLMTGRPSPAMA